MKDAFALAVSHAGNLTRLAKAIGKRQSTLWHWNKTRVVPAEYCAAIELATGGKVTKADLRPDVFGPPQGADLHGDPKQAGRTHDP